MRDVSSPSIPAIVEEILDVRPWLRFQGIIPAGRPHTFTRLSVLDACIILRIHIVFLSNKNGNGLPYAKFRGLSVDFLFR
jgi:hypothetical protein